jgi:hypothetical protein
MPITRERSAKRITKVGVRTAIAIGTDARVRQSPPNQETIAGHARTAVAVGRPNDTIEIVDRPGPPRHPSCPSR